MQNKVIVIYDEIAVGGLVKHIVEDLGFDCQVFNEPMYACKEIIKQKPFLVVSDLSMPKMSGLELLKRCKPESPDTEFLLMTGFGTIESAVECINIGALNYIQKPLNLDLLRHLINQTSEKASLKNENRELHQRLKDQSGINGIIGSSLQISNVCDRIKKVAKSDANVLVTGESGTGKELVARAIHDLSDRYKSSFVGVDCVALPESLFESQLFGYEKGAFTGAEKEHKGLLEVAENGTFFMDEVTELDYSLQAKLLRVLQERQFRRVGGEDLIDAKVRIVSATRRDPEQAVKDNIFREDLFYRLNVIPVHLPALRERSEDIPLLIDHFQKAEAEKTGVIAEIDEDAMDCLLNYQWPGNIRELRNIIIRLSVLCKDNIIRTQDLPASIGGSKRAADFDLSWAINLPFKEAKDLMLEKFEKRYIHEHLKISNGNITQAALESGLNRKTFHRLINKYDLSVYR